MVRSTKLSLLLQLLTVLQTMNLVVGMCFNELPPTTSLSRFAIVVPSQPVTNHDNCKEKCWALDTCLAYSYVDTKCALLGEVINDSMCSVKNKNEIIGMKCEESTPTPTPSTTPAPPPCLSDIAWLKKNKYILDPSACGTLPDTMTCTDLMCYCHEGKQLVVPAGGTIYTGSLIYCASDKKWKVLGPTDAATSELFATSALSGACKSIPPHPIASCQCSMPLVRGAQRNGDDLCPGKGVLGWQDVNTGNGPLSTSALVCREEGWKSAGKAVKPQKVVCK